MNSKMDPMGRAIAEYHRTGKAARLRVFSPMFEEDEIPMQTLFRTYQSMPRIEQTALDMAKAGRWMRGPPLAVIPSSCRNGALM